MRIDAEGWCHGLRRIASPNCDRRLPGTEVSLLVIHNISLPPGEFGGKAIEQLFTNTLDCDTHPYYERLRGLQVSAHFLVRRDGQLIQFVSCSKRAWHAGVSEWQGRSRCNDFSLGIELEGDDDTPFTDAQYAALIRLTRRLQRHYPLRDITGHSDIAPGRKTDPGPYFDWPRFLSALQA
ncbi:1,6-anhydro-N-acetylmuramyl-L-alanine amidase AmpD [Ferriphaselus sp. R-1]|uniref:1,6-anhydro-N-acetylmuramyl-L-alanine amidase AmpD n=1 Tax=Ferriphaselus sp. R-1 TaxID=1485544 RepID=UPI0005558C98|nr:1,6-anhydro-N-acetylmuramyl-L-alanine amidase AmpD [Ferriphaselus sp. R-1]